MAKNYKEFLQGFFEGYGKQLGGNEHMKFCYISSCSSNIKNLGVFACCVLNILTVVKSVSCKFT